MDMLVRRAAAAGLPLRTSEAERIWTYFTLLAKWNTKVNLTGFRVSTENEAAIDRLLIEPLLAARHVDAATQMIDVGSGGGSPAIPLAIAITPSPRLAMVESRQRKVAFLREALRETGLAGEVHAARFEDFARSTPPGMFDLLSIRAVRLDAGLLSSAAHVLCPGGLLLHLHEQGVVHDASPSIHWDASEELLASTRSWITLGTRRG